MCLTPYEKLDRDVGKIFTFPCGKCPVCASRRASAWSFRLMQQDKIAITSYFITLTYDTSFVPITNKGYMSLRKRDLQLFFKRLRKAHGNIRESSLPPIKYYAVGEYGGKTKRPHYHIILFNARLETIEKAWQLGHIHYGSVSGASVGYTLKYISKPSKVPMHQNDDRQKEFSVMSKGLGKNYLTDAIKQWHYEDLENRVYLNLEDGKKASMPRYYKDKMYDEIQRDKIKNAWLEKFQADEQLRDYKYTHEYFASVDAAIRKQITQQNKNDKL